MVPRLIEMNAKSLVGRRRVLSLVENATSELWRDFLPSIQAVPNRVGCELFSLQNYPQDYFRNFDPRAKFEKWAAVEVQDHQKVPSGMEPYLLPAGLFAVFHYVGSSNDAPKVFQYIYGEWLPRSEFNLDQRPHFEILGEKYRNNDPLSEEDIWIPIRAK